MDIYISEKQENGPPKLIKACHNVRVVSIRIIDNILIFAWVDHVFTKGLDLLEPIEVDYPHVISSLDYHMQAESINLEGKDITFTES